MPEGRQFLNPGIREDDRLAFDCDAGKLETCSWLPVSLLNNVVLPEFWLPIRANVNDSFAIFCAFYLS